LTTIKVLSYVAMLRMKEQFKKILTNEYINVKTDCSTLETTLLSILRDVLGDAEGAAY
jgi:hypothetical protein